MRFAQPNSERFSPAVSSLNGLAETIAALLA
jgi:hypothetical protein